MVSEVIKWGQHKIISKEVASKDLQFLGICTNLVKDMAQWKNKIYIGDLYLPYVMLFEELFSAPEIYMPVENIKNF